MGNYIKVAVTNSIRKIRVRKNRVKPRFLTVKHEDDTEGPFKEEGSPAGID